MGREFPGQPVVGVGAVLLRGGMGGTPVEVLLVRRANPPSQGEWSLPGGVVELGEGLEAAIAREVLEETGLVVEPYAIVEVLDHIVLETPGGDDTARRIRFHYVLIDYICRVLGGTLATASDAADASWRTVDDLPDVHPLTVAVIHKAVTLRND